MSVRGPSWPHSLPFNLGRNDVRSGKLECRKTLKEIAFLSDLMQLWLTQFNRGRSRRSRGRDGHGGHFQFLHDGNF